MSAQSISSKQNHFFGTKVKLPYKAYFLAVGVYLKNFFYMCSANKKRYMLAIKTETFKRRVTIKINVWPTKRDDYSRGRL